jgi:hypothetical protein
VIAKNAEATRTFPCEWIEVEERELVIGDAAEISAVTITLQDGTLIQTLDSSAWVELERDREDWEPITSLEFPLFVLNAAALSIATLINVTATWGFPSVPDTIRRSVATLVIHRYLNDPAAVGTAFANAANRDEFNLAGALKVALNTRDRFGVPSLG